MAGAWLAGCSRSADNSAAAAAAPPPPAVTVAQPVQKDVMEWDEYTGRLDAAETVEIRARVSGYLDKVLFEAGKKVQKGDLLFVIDQRQYRAEVERAEATLQQANAQSALAKSELERAKRLFSTHVLAEEQLDIRSRELEEAEATVRADNAALELAKLNLEFTEIRAPISGRISRELVTPGNLIVGGGNEATLLAVLVSIDPIYAYLDADERSVLKYRRLAREGKRESARDAHIPVEMALADEHGFPHQGYIDYVEPRLDPNTSTVRARAVFSNADDQLSAGFFARVRIPGSGKYPALLVTDRAVGIDQGQQYLMVVNAKHIVEYRPVKLGADIDGLRVIKSGIEAGDWIIVNGLQRARPGAPVTPQQTTMTEFVAQAASPAADASPGAKN
ncbi:MAG TPA: efflux RND transporter periplasmic adaptor subunit [Gammaproteobacteria bacterium]|nr:efflux RND transporter periplasmic adaptor subunit [Gammaproteobacteria bacterium]